MRHLGGYGSDAVREKASTLDRNRVLLDLIAVASQVSAANTAIHAPELQKDIIKSVLEKWDK